VTQVIERIARSNVEWTMDIDQGAVEIEENCFEASFQAKCRRARVRHSVRRRAAPFLIDRLSLGAWSIAPRTPAGTAA
jgi:hypothetical protein